MTVPVEWKPTNSEQMIPWEHIHGTINGVDFGPQVYVVARGPVAMLLWMGGHSWSNNGFQRYASSHLTLIRDRTRIDGHRCYKSLEPSGGRLTLARMELAKAEICELFGDHWNALVRAVQTRETLLVEGGGNQPQPSHSRGERAYREWRHS